MGLEIKVYCWCCCCCWWWWWWWWWWCFVEREKVVGGVLSEGKGGERKREKMLERRKRKRGEGEKKNWLFHSFLFLHYSPFLILPLSPPQLKNKMKARGKNKKKKEKNNEERQKEKKTKKRKRNKRGFYLNETVKLKTHINDFYIIIFILFFLLNLFDFWESRKETSQIPPHCPTTHSVCMKMT